MHCSPRKYPPLLESTTIQSLFPGHFNICLVDIGPNGYSIVLLKIRKKKERYIIQQGKIHDSALHSILKFISYVNFYLQFMS